VGAGERLRSADGLPVALALLAKIDAIDELVLVAVVDAPAQLDHGRAWLEPARRRRRMVRRRLVTDGNFAHARALILRLIINREIAQHRARRSEVCAHLQIAPARRGDPTHAAVAELLG